MAHVFAFMQGFCGVRAASRYKFYRSRDPDSYRDITDYKSWLRVRARSRYKALENYPGAGAKCKTYDKQLAFIDRVRFS